MRDCIPNEEDFETILAALYSHERTLATEIVVAEAVSRIDLTDVEAFKTAFSAPPQSAKSRDDEKVLAATRLVRDKIALLKAKIIQFRNHVRSASDQAAISDLLT